MEPRFCKLFLYPRSHVAAGHYHAAYDGEEHDVMEKNKRIKHPVILGTAAAVGAASAVALGEIYRYLFCRDPGLIAKFDKKGHASDYYEHRDSAAARMGQTPCTRYTIYSDRGDRLEGFYYQSGDKPAGRIAFIVQIGRAHV